MKAFLWHECEEITSNYHADGSVLIEAESIERARAIAKFTKTVYDKNSKKYIGEVVTMSGVEREPNAIFESSGTEEKVWVFPNAGCC